MLLTYIIVAVGAVCTISITTGISASIEPAFPQKYYRPVLAYHFYCQANLPSIIIIIVLPSQSSIFNNLVESRSLVCLGKSSMNLIAPFTPKVSYPPIKVLPPQFVNNQKDYEKMHTYRPYFLKVKIHII